MVTWPPAPHLALGLFQGAGGALVGVSSGDDSLVVEGALHDRLALLTRGLPADVPLVVSLSGGGEVMSAILQSAFSLRARPIDRLVRVLPTARAERLEAALGADGPLWFPGCPGVDHLRDVPPDPASLVTGHDVAAAPVSVLWGMGEAARAALLDLPAARMLATMRQRFHARPWLRFERGGRAGYRLVLLDREREVGRARVGEQAGTAWIALAAGPRCSREDVLDRISDPGLIPAERSAGLVRRWRRDVALRVVSDALREAREKAEELRAAFPSFPLEDLAPRALPGNREWEVRARDRVQVVWPMAVG